VTPTDLVNTLQAGDLLKVMVGGEERFGTFEGWGRDSRAEVRLGHAGTAHVHLNDVLENRSEQERGCK